MAASGRGAMYTMVRYGTSVQRMHCVRVCIKSLALYNLHIIKRYFLYDYSIVPELNAIIPCHKFKQLANGLLIIVRRAGLL